MKGRTIVLLGTFALAGLSRPCEAQTESRPRTMTAAPASASRPAAQPTNRPRTATIPASPPAQPVPVNTTGLFTNFNAPAPSGQPVYAPPVYGQPVVTQLYYLPTVVLSDGRVLANFGTGRGYEQVLRECPRFTGTMPPSYAVSPCWSRDAYGRYNVLYQH